MQTFATNQVLSSIDNGKHFILPMALCGIVLVMIIPLPSIVLDFLISFNIIISTIILMVSIYIMRPLDFSVFPSILLVITLFRLALNISSTRLILLHGSEGTDAAGKVIQAFGSFVVGGNYGVGLVVFMVLIVIQYIVITHGSVRVSEVNARFTLDAMPGKQMSVDADLNSGIIDEEEARVRREQISREAEFYGSMDGAVRFTQRDAVAALLITLINISAGLGFGIFFYHMNLMDAVKTFIILTIGDGLVSVIPALLIAVAGGIVTTRATSNSSLGEEFSRQLLKDYRPLMISSGVLFVFALIPGLPKLPFIVIAMVFGTISLVTLNTAGNIDKNNNIGQGHCQEQDLDLNTIDDLLHVDLLALEVGYGLLPLADSSSKNNLLHQVNSIRKKIALELGIILPAINIKDNLNLKPTEYCFSIKGNEVARGNLKMGYFLAIPGNNLSWEVDGIKTHEPVFGSEALWVKNASEAEKAGYTVVDSTNIIATHLSEIVKNHGHELLTRQSTQELLDKIAKTNPKIIEELIPKTITVGGIQKILQNLLREKVSIRDLTTILETISDNAENVKDYNMLSEYARQTLGRSICKNLVTNTNQLRVIVLDPEIEKTLLSSLEPCDPGSCLVMNTSESQKIIDSIQCSINKQHGCSPVILTSPLLRPHLKKLTEHSIPELVVISTNEIPSNIDILPTGKITKHAA